MGNPWNTLGLLKPDRPHDWSYQPREGRRRLKRREKREKAMLIAATLAVKLKELDWPEPAIAFALKMVARHGVPALRQIEQLLPDDNTTTP